jgi:hypothetical protein
MKAFLKIQPAVYALPLTESREVTSISTSLNWTYEPHTAKVSFPTLYPVGDVARQ